MQLEGLSVIVTGAGRGLGRAAALALAASGACVTIMSRSRGELEDVAGAVEGSGQCLPAPGDVRQPGDVARTVNAARERFGRIDVLVNNAAVIGPPRFVEDAIPEAWQGTLETNLTGAYLCTHQVVPHMIENGGGSIINITSGLARMPYPRFCAYGASKAGIDQMTRSLAEELKPDGIRVNAVDPGVMDTRMQADLRDLGPQTLSRPIHQRFVEFKKTGDLRDPAAVAPLIVYLASPGAAHLTGRIGGLGDYAEWGWTPEPRSGKSSRS